jgi:nitroreductase
MHTKTTDATAAVDKVIRSRTTVRAFRPDPVPRSQLVEILDLARMAPSNFNSQPWRVHVVEGAAKRALREALLRAHSANTHLQFSPFPQSPPPDCGARVDDFGRRYYTALGIDRADMAARARQTGRNFLFFGAPVGFIFTIDSALTKHSWLDFGLFIQNVILAAHARGLATCPQGLSAIFRAMALRLLDSVLYTTSPRRQFTLCGAGYGHADVARFA